MTWKIENHETDDVFSLTHIEDDVPIWVHEQLGTDSLEDIFNVLSNYHPENFDTYPPHQKDACGVYWDNPWED